MYRIYNIGIILYIAYTVMYNHYTQVYILKNLYNNMYNIWLL